MEVNRYIDKLKKIISLAIIKKKYELALNCAKTLSSIYYDYNQIYADFELEKSLLEIRNKILDKSDYIVDEKTVFFYDGFGLDLRGWAASYVRALSGLGYYVIYCCPDSSEGKIPHILAELDGRNSKVIYVNNDKSNIDRTKSIDLIFKKHKPCAAFFYTLPNDVDAAVAFSNNEPTTRFQIDLTDHAYWIGINAFNYCIECREMGASLALYERKINKQQILKLDCAPYIINDKMDEPFPFDIYKERYIFTGGALYKTLGDKELLYYKTISYILNRYDEIKFLYAGSGDDSQIKVLMKVYPERVFLIQERTDFFEIIQNSLLYINSYPMFGGLMMRYAALAHKIPITLKHDHDSDGILIDQDKLEIEFDNYQEYLDEIDKIISDDEYRHQKEEKIRNAVISEKDFADNIDELIKHNKTIYSFEKIDKLDTTKFRNEYKVRYKKSMIYKTIARKSNLGLIKYFPYEYICGLVLKIKEKIS